MEAERVCGGESVTNDNTSMHRTHNYLPSTMRLWMRSATDAAAIDVAVASASAFAAEIRFCSNG